MRARWIIFASVALSAPAEAQKTESDSAVEPGLPPGVQPEFDRTRVFQPSEVTRSRTATLLGQQPQYGTRSTAAIGERMFTRYSYTVATLARLNAPLEITGARGERHVVSPSEDLGIPYFASGTVMPLGPYPLDWLCTQAQTFTRRNGERALSCFQDKDGDGRFEMVGRTYGRNALPIAQPVPYTITPSAVTAVNSRFELLYLGRSGGTLRVAYREYSNELARPAFSAELTFDISPQGETIFRHRDLRVTVHQATNETITYTVQPAT